MAGRKTRTTRPWQRRVVDAVAASVHFSPLGIGVQAISFRLIMRVLRDNTFSAFQWFPLFGHALVPSGFRLQVNPMAQERSSEFLLAVPGIQHRVPRRTALPHTAPTSG